tara:strand:- start:31769 stop:32227 length:459 start_codon:yes stop_codon:yes gene_type:complete
VGGKVLHKMKFIKEYKFVISFENSEYDGYTTEKIVEPIYEDCIPIYWGNKLVSNDFNSKRFLDYNKFESEKKLIDKLLEIDQNEELAIAMLMQPAFSENKLPHEEEREEVLSILSTIIEKLQKPIARTLWRYVHRFKIGYKKSQKKMKCIFN